MDNLTPHAAQLEQMDQSLRYIRVTDRELLATYQRIGYGPGNPEADALLAEIKRRGLGF